MAIPCFIIQAGPQEIWPDGGARKQIHPYGVLRMGGGSNGLDIFVFKGLSTLDTRIRRKRKPNLHQTLPLREPNQI